MGDIYTQVPQVNENGEFLVSDNGLYLNQTELKKVGNINPDGVGGLYNSFSYKNFSLDFSIDFRIGGDVINEMNQPIPKNATSQVHFEINIDSFQFYGVSKQFFFSPVAHNRHTGRERIFICFYK